MGDTDEHRQLFDLVEKMLEYDPIHRITGSDALKHQFFDKLPAEKKGEVEPKNEQRARSHSLSR